MHFVICKIYSVHGKFITECSFLTLMHVPLDDNVHFYRKQFSPLFNKTGKLQVFVLYLA